MKAFLHRFLTSALDGDEWSLSCLQYPWKEGWRGPKDSLKYSWMEHYLVLPGIEPRLLVRPARNPVVISTDISCIIGRAVAQAVSHWLPIAATRVRARVWSCGICGGQSGAGAGFFRVLRFPLPNFISPSAPQSPSSIMWGWYNRPVVAAVPSWLSLTPLRIILHYAICGENTTKLATRCNFHKDPTSLISDCTPPNSPQNRSPVLTWTYVLLILKPIINSEWVSYTDF
jgi:hypothetical protein